MTRRQRLHIFLAAAALSVAAIALFNQAKAIGKAIEPPPHLTCEAAVYRADGGQTIKAGTTLKPNDLSLLNCGQRLNLASAEPSLLAALPGLGQRSAIRAQTRGHLTDRERGRLSTLIKEPTHNNK